MASTADSHANTILIFFVIVILVALFWEPIAKALGIKQTGSKVASSSPSTSSDQTSSSVTNPTDVSSDGKGKCTVYNQDGSEVVIEGNLNDPQFEKLCRDSNLNNYYYPIYYYGVPFFGFSSGRHRGHGGHR